MCTLPYDENQSLALVALVVRRYVVGQRPTTNDQRQGFMRIAYLDCFSGISGDMFLGALVDAGVPARLLEETVAALNIGARLEISRVKRNGISATKVDVFSHGEKDLPREIYWEQKTGQPEHSTHNHGNREHSHTKIAEPVALLEHNYALQNSAPARHEGTFPKAKSASIDSEPASHSHEHGTDQNHGRGLNEIRKIIAKTAISDLAKDTAVAIFEALGAAEAKIHATDIEKIHFHEVGAIDAMVDIVCAAVGAEALGVDEIVCSPLNVGGGTVRVRPRNPAGTGASHARIVEKCARVFLRHSIRTGYSDWGCDRENAGETIRAIPANERRENRIRRGHRVTLTDMRMLCGLPSAKPYPMLSQDKETITVIEANIDDLNPQVFGYVVDRLLDEGALDAFGMPVQMKKNRPGMLLTVLCRNEDASRLTDLIFIETTTLGVRQREEKRRTLAREWVTVATRWGNVRLKVASMNGATINYAPEYEDCRRIASEHHVPLKTVMQEALQLYLNGKR